jgi:hypothetical protein
MITAHIGGVPVEELVPLWFTGGAVAARAWWRGRRRRLR